MASRFSVDPQKLHTTLKNTVFKGASDEEMLSLVVVANSYNLNPLTKEIYAFPAKGGGIVPVVSVDGWLRILNDHPQMDGVEFEFTNDERGDLESCTCIIFRKDRSKPIKVTEYLAECRRNTEPWKMQHRMLRHKALIQCARVAFGFSGIYDEDEAERFASARPIEAQVVANKPVFAAAANEPEAEKPKRTPRKAKVEPEPEPEDDQIPGLPEPNENEAAETQPEDLLEFDTTPTDKKKSPQQMLYEGLADCGIVERSFITWIRKRGIEAETVMSLPDNIAQDCCDNFQAIQDALA